MDEDIKGKPVRSFSKDEMDFMDDIMTHGIKGKSPNPNAKVLNPDLKITKWQGKLGPEPNPLPSSHYRKIATKS